jgi:antitoxin component of RelBE/YafQ-DinJ toxin-antitoxin module
MKDNYIRFRLSTEEKQEAEKAAEAANKTLSELIRFLLINFAKKVIPVHTTKADSNPTPISVEH